jgi:hypothetical protein
MIHILQIYMGINSLPQLRSDSIGKHFIEGKPPGEEGCTTQ